MSLKRTTGLEQSIILSKSSPTSSGSSSSSNNPYSSNQIDLHNLTQLELVQRVRKLETDLLKLASDHNQMIREANQHIQNQNGELNGLKNTVAKLEEDNSELRDLCCFLDDDRQKGRKLAREWQRFGRYTATVMRQEVAAYQNKLRELERKQQQLISDNTELKELCLYLDEERNQCVQCGLEKRDDGDGSSSNIPTDEESWNIQNSSNKNESLILQKRSGSISGSPSFDKSSNSGTSNTTIRELIRDESGRSVLGSQIVEYVKFLERRVCELEKHEPIQCPESVLNALQILQVCQGLENEHEDIGDQEKALVRQMCNVVWKKLEDNPKFIQKK